MAEYIKKSIAIAIVSDSADMYPFEKNEAIRTDCGFHARRRCAGGAWEVGNRQVRDGAFRVLYLQGHVCRRRLLELLPEMWCKNGFEVRILCRIII